MNMKLLIISTLLGVNSAFAAPAQVIARSGQTAVGVNGHSYHGLFRDNAASPVALPAPMMAGDLVALHASLRQGASIPATDKGLWLLHQSGGGRSVARIGQHAPGTAAGVNYSGSFSQSVDAYGRSLFIAELAGQGVTPGLNSQGIWTADMNNTELTARLPEEAPGTSPLGYFRTFNEVTPLDGSIGADLAIRAIVTSLPGQPITIPVTSGLWARSGSALAMVSWSHGDVPGLTNTWFSDAYHQIGPSGRGATVARMYGPNITTTVINGTPVTDDWVMLRTAPGSRQIVARAVSQAPGTPVGVVFQTIASSTGLPAVNSAGDIIFNATVIGPGVTTLNRTGLWRSSANGVSLVARGGEPATAAGTGVVFDSLLGNASSGSLAVMDNGDAVFWSYFAGTGVNLNNCRGIYKRSAAGQDTLIGRSGVANAALPIGTTLVRTTFPLMMKTAGADHVMFTAQLSGTGVTANNNDVLMRHRQASGLQLIAREGDIIGSHILKSFVGNGADMQITANGYAVVPVTLAPVKNPNATPQLGVLGVSPSGALQILAAKGASIELSDGSLPVISDLRIAAKSALNDSGKVAIAAMFSSNPRDEAVFVASINSGSACPADFDQDGSVGVPDIFAFLAAFFAQDPRADFDGSGSVAVSDIFAFLNVWFEGC